MLAYEVHAKDYERVSVVTCKSWQVGFNPERWVLNLTNKKDARMGSRDAWKFFRELVSQKWTNAFVREIEKETVQTTFTYYVVCTRLYGKTDRTVFEQSTAFLKNFERAGADFRIKIMTFEELFKEYFDRVQKNSRTTLEATQIGRLLQLIKASGVLK